jgi:hypothetical protein
MSDTPRTDSRIVKMLSDLQSGTMDVVHADFARDLERELAEILGHFEAAGRELSALKHDIQRHVGIAAAEATRAEAAERERDELNKVLRQAGWGQGEIDSAAEMLFKAESASAALREDAERYRWLAADGNRARKLLNDLSGFEVECAIDQGRALAGKEAT